MEEPDNADDANDGHLLDTFTNFQEYLLYIYYFSYGFDYLAFHLARLRELACLRFHSEEYPDSILLMLF